jgi:streptogramin lyase
MDLRACGYPLVVRLALVLLGLLAPVTPHAQGVTEFPLPPTRLPWAITTEPDGALWFTETYVSKIGRITTGGAITEFPVPTLSNYQIAAGPDGNVWITESTTAGQIVLSPSASGVPLATSVAYRPGQSRANNVTVGLGASGALVVHCTQPFGTAHLILDVSGYFQ